VRSWGCAGAFRERDEMTNHWYEAGPPARLANYGLSPRDVGAGGSSSPAIPAPYLAERVVPGGPVAGIHATRIWNRTRSVNAAAPPSS
jgi:hypothetical protein